MSSGPKIRMRPTVVYRFYRVDGELLYVGLSMNIEGRLITHKIQRGRLATGRADRVDLVRDAARGDGCRGAGDPDGEPALEPQPFTCI